MDLPDIDTKLVAVAAAAVLVVGGAGLALSGSSGGSGGGELQPAGDWTGIELETVRGGESFTAGQFDQPVIVETFAVWCPTCTRQQQEVKALHEQVGEDIISISLNTDPNEDAAKVRQHAERHGFDWRYAVAPSDMTRALIDAYGQGIVNAPSVPMVLVCPDDTAVRLPDGVKSAETLQETVDARC